MVGSDQYLECTSICEVVAMDIQDNTCILDLYILLISGANIVFGVQWLKTLGPVLTNYNTLSMQFFYQDRLVELQGEHDTNLGALNQHQFYRLCCRHADTSYFHIMVMPEASIFPNAQDIPQEIQHSLTKFMLLFQQPHALPPTRTTDHHIHLLPHSSPVNVCPYRYPNY